MLLIFFGTFELIVDIAIYLLLINKSVLFHSIDFKV